VVQEDAPTVCKDTVVDLYERHTREYDRDRSRSLQERAWLDRFVIYVRRAGTVLDLGCGMGEPIARHLLDRGFRVVGVDGSPAMIELCQARFSDSEWLVADMRQLELARRFEGILASDSFFHLGKDDQRMMFRRFASHPQSGATLMFTIGPAEGEAIGVCWKDRLYHASLGPAEYEELFETNGFAVRAYGAEDPHQCDGHTVWLATYETPMAAG
jgi:trans-aconitate methyltransferase